ncbi:MAG: hypothetical protein ACK5TQ_04465 [Acetobacteraceae bacterium]
MASSGPIEDRLLRLANRILAEARDQERMDSDLTWRWMAHHVAELMDLAEHGPPEGRAAAALECNQAILALWRHRYCSEYGRRPFDAYVPLADALSQRKDPWVRHKHPPLGSPNPADAPRLAALQDIEVGANAAVELITSLVAARLNSDATVSDMSILCDAEAVSSGDPDVLVMQLFKQTSDIVLSSEPGRQADRHRLTMALDLLATRASELANEARRVSKELGDSSPNDSCVL